jgi:hypothetical protein
LDFRDPAKPLMVASMVQDDKVVFSLGRPQPPPDGLNEPYPRPGRPRIDNAANVEVNAGVESGDVADDFGLAGAEPVKDLLAFEQRSVAIDVLRCDAGLDETLLKVLRVFPVNAVTKRRPVLAFTRTTF